MVLLLRTFKILQLERTLFEPFAQLRLTVINRPDAQHGHACSVYALECSIHAL